MATQQYPQDPAVRSFKAFIYLLWQELGLPEPTPAQYALAEYLEKAPKRSMLECFRGIGKSILTDAYVVWRLYWNPKLNILVVSGSQKRANDFSTFALSLMRDISWLAWLMPDPSIGCRESKISFDVAPNPGGQFPSVQSVGITGQMTGARADLIVADDIETLSNSDSQLKRDKLAEKIKEFDAILKPEPTSEIKYLGTPQSETSIYNSLEERGYEIRVWPARYPKQEKLAGYGGRLFPQILDDLLDENGRYREELAWAPTDPKRFNEIELATRERSYGRTGFALQFQLDTSLSDAERYPLRARDLMVLSCNPHQAPAHPLWTEDYEHRWKDLECDGLSGDYFVRPHDFRGEYLPYEGSVMTIDPSGRGKDETGVAVVKALRGTLWALECTGLQGGYDEPTLEAIAQMAKKQQVNEIIVESNFGDGMFTTLLKPVLARVYPCSVEEVRHNTQKELRICDTLEPVISSHRLVVDYRVIAEDFETGKHLEAQERRRKRLIYQLTRITRDRGALVHDDRLEALAMAVAYWTERLDIDRSNEEQRAKEAEYERFWAQLDCELGLEESRGTNWCDSYGPG